MKLDDLEVNKPQKNTKAVRFLESQHGMKIGSVMKDPTQAATLLDKVKKLKEDQFYSKTDFHLSPNYTKLAMMEQLLKEAAEGSVVMEDDEMPAAGGENLEQAELVLAVQDMVEDIQGMAEDLAGMQVQKLMPLVTKMKAAFGMDKAQAFEDAANKALGAALESIKGTNDEMSNAIAVLQGNAPAMAATDDFDLGTDDASDDTSDELDLGSDEVADGDDASSGPAEEPLGRGLKDEVI